MKKNKFKILKLRYEDQVELLRYLTSLELKIIFGYFTVTIAIIAWLITQKDLVKEGKEIFAIAILITTMIVLYYLRSQKIRRDEAVETVKNLNKAFGLYRKGAFLKNKAINPKSNYKPLFKLYLLSVLSICFLSIYMILFKLN